MGHIHSHVNLAGKVTMVLHLFKFFFFHASNCLVHVFKMETVAQYHEFSLHFRSSNPCSYLNAE